MFASGFRALALSSAALGLWFGFVALAPGGSVTMKDCALRFHAAQESGDTTAWADFRKAQCGVRPASNPVDRF